MDDKRRESWLVRFIMKLERWLTKTNREYNKDWNERERKKEIKRREREERRIKKEKRRKNSRGKVEVERKRKRKAWKRIEKRIVSFKGIDKKVESEIKRNVYYCLKCKNNIKSR